MLVHLRRDELNLAVPAAELLLLALAWRADQHWAIFGTLGLLAAVGMYGWLRSLLRGRTISDTPTSRIASAAQGYVELQGRGQPLAGTPLLSPLNGFPVLWFRLDTYRRRSRAAQPLDGLEFLPGERWELEHRQQSDDSFLLADDSGECAVDPTGAEILVDRREVTTRGDRRYIQWVLLRDDPLYVLGEFHTLGSVAPGFDQAVQVRELLSEWKRDRASLLQRFDLDGDGEIDLHEWELARAQARREVRQLHDEVLAAPEAHLVRKPGDNRLYLISNRDPATIARRYRGWSLFHALVFMLACGAMAWLANTPAA